MVRILVCFKIVDDTDELLAADWEGLGTGGPDTSYLRRTAGCYDEAALENALLLKDAYTKLGLIAEVTAVTIDPGYSDHIISAFPAIGIDHTFCIEESADLRFLPERTAGLLFGFIQKTGPYDIVVAGSKTPPAASGIVPFILAEKLTLPCISEVSEMCPSPERVTLWHELTEGECVRNVKGPFVCTIGNAKKSYLRIPTLRERLQADKTTIKQITVENDTCFAELKGSVTLSDLIREKEERICIFAAGENAREKALFVYENKLKGLLG